MIVVGMQVVVLRIVVVGMPVVVFIVRLGDLVVNGIIVVPFGVFLPVLVTVKYTIKLTVDTKTRLNKINASIVNISFILNFILFLIK
jgi:hypothetical protein